jgi:hypothetical protein
LVLRSCYLTVQLASQLLSATALTALQWDRVQLHQEDWTAVHGLPVLWHQQLQLLPSLASLRLAFRESMCVTAADIAPLSNLQRLQRFTLDTPFAVGCDQSSPRALLSALQHLTQLQHLELSKCCLDKVQPALNQQQQPDAYQCFSALTASTQLTALVLAQDKWNAVIPRAAFSRMFPTGRVVQEIAVLRLDCSRAANHQCVEAAQVAMIAASCPALQKLKLQGVTPMYFDTRCLLQLPASVTRVEGLGWVRPAP